MFKRCSICNKRVVLSFKSDGADLCYQCFSKIKIEKVWKKCPLCKSTNGFNATEKILSNPGLSVGITCKSCGAFWGTSIFEKPDVKSKIIDVAGLLDRGSNDKVFSSIINRIEPLEWWLSSEVDKIEKGQTTAISGSTIGFFKDEVIKYEIKKVEITKIEPQFINEARLVLTNYRLLLFLDGSATFSENNPPLHYFSRSMEFADITSINVSSDTLKLFFMDNTELNLNIKLSDDLTNLKKELDQAIKSKFSLITFEDEEEKIIYKQTLFFNGTSFVDCKDYFRWASIFNSMKTTATLCITDKRIIFYRIEQVEKMEASNNISTSLWTTKYIVSANWLKHPSLRILIIPLNYIKTINLKTNIIGGKIKMKLTGVASAWHLEDSLVIPTYLIEDEQLKKIPIETSKNAGKEYEVELFDPTKKYAPKIIEALQQIIPEKIIPTNL